MKPKKKEQILKIADGLFNRFGIKRTGVDEIAKLANVAKGTIYNYFGDKEGLFRALGKQKISIFDQRIEKAFGKIKDPVERLKIVLTERLEMSINTPFISDSILQINYEDRIKTLINDLDKKSKEIVSRIIEGAYQRKLPLTEKKTIINTILFTLKGMDESIRNRLEPVSIRKFKKDIDYLVKVIFAQHSFESNGN
ncbi:MAG: TetR/AcrR family transcriptional regulator [Proteobacteria bacterium]|nr:TetR/AcrR family transcriptional regulator [Pseudomonadota bacterium]